MEKYFVLEGPADAGNVFGYFKPGLVPEGRFIIASRGEYVNGGSGPSTADGKLYRTREGAEAALAELAEESRK